MGAKAYTTTPEKKIDSDGNVFYTQTLIVAASLQKAKIIEKVTGTQKLDGWYQIEEQTFCGNKISRYPIINQLN